MADGNALLGDQGAKGGEGDKGAPAFVAADAVKFLADYVEPKSLEGVAEADLKTRYEATKGIADKAYAKGKAEGGAKAPEKYELKVPQGYEADAESTKEYEQFARESGLSQEAAQKGYELGGKIVKRAVEKLEAEVSTAQTAWLEQSKSDREFGGEKLQENLSIAKKARDAFATPELRSFLDETRLGNHPEVLRLFFRIGKALKEDNTVVAGQSRSADKPVESRLYGKTTG